MTYAAESLAIIQRFHAEWQEAQGFDDDQMGVPESFDGVTRVAWPNKNFDPPPGLSWVRLSILTDQANLAGLGTDDGNRYRHGGMISVQVFVPSGQGDGEARTLADQVCAIFRDQSFGGVRSGAPYVTESGDDGAGWYGLVMWCPYYRDSFF